MNRLSVKFLAVVFTGAVVFLGCRAQSSKIINKEALIQSSQAAAMPVFFDVNQPGIPTVDVGEREYKGEFIVRAGLSNFFYKAKRGDTLRIGFIGGSITRADHLYRTQAARYIQSLFPKAKIQGINAGVSGTGSDLGACRVQEQMLKYRPDLVFIEFAVNGAFAPGVEGIIRQIRKSDPTTDICMLYTISAGQAAQYFSGKIPEGVQRLEKVAEHYQIPSVHMGLSIGFLEHEGSVVWKGPSSDPRKVVFTADGLHPTHNGGTLYAAAIARAFNAMKDNILVHGIVQHDLPPALIPDNWEDARMLDPAGFAAFSTGWKSIDPESTSHINEFKPWFPYVMRGDKPGESFSFKFKGTAFGLFDIGGPEVGQLIITIDGETRRVNRFNNYCNNRYRGQYFILKVPEGEHTVRFEIDPVNPNKAEILGESQQSDIQGHPEKYDQHVIYVGKILIRGVPLPGF